MKILPVGAELFHVCESDR